MAEGVGGKEPPSRRPQLCDHVTRRAGTFSNHDAVIYAHDLTNFFTILAGTSTRSDSLVPLILRCDSGET